jgi:hypothetical protein
MEKRIHKNRWDNWNGYEGRKRVIEFGLDEQAARNWLDVGSPKKGHTSMIKRTLFLPDELWTALGRVSTKTGAPIAELVRRAIIAYLKKEGESR